MNIHLHIANVHVHVKDDKHMEMITDILKTHTHQLKKIIMTNEEAIQLQKDILAQVVKVRGEVQKLIDAAQNNGNVSPELAQAITDTKSALQGLDDLNTDEPVEPPTEG